MLKIKANIQHVALKITVSSNLVIPPKNIPYFCKEQRNLLASIFCAKKRSEASISSMYTPKIYNTCLQCLHCAK